MLRFFRRKVEIGADQEKNRQQTNNTSRVNPLKKLFFWHKSNSRRQNSLTLNSGTILQSADKKTGQNEASRRYGTFYFERTPRKIQLRALSDTETDESSSSFSENEDNTGLFWRKFEEERLAGASESSSRQLRSK